MNLSHPNPPRGHPCTAEDDNKHLCESTALPWAAGHVHRVLRGDASAVSSVSVVSCLSHCLISLFNWLRRCLISLFNLLRQRGCRQWHSQIISQKRCRMRVTLLDMGPNIPTHHPSQQEGGSNRAGGNQVCTGQRLLVRSKPSLHESFFPLTHKPTSGTAGKRKVQQSTKLTAVFTSFIWAAPEGSSQSSHHMRWRQVKTSSNKTLPHACCNHCKVGEGTQFWRLIQDQQIP